MTKLLKQQAALMAKDNRKHGPILKRETFAKDLAPAGLVDLWRSNRFLVQLYEARDGGQRLSVCRTMLDTTTGRWLDGITWDELQAIKRQVGFGDRMAVEIYPADAQVVNVANMRHLWILDQPLPFAWKKSQ